MLFKIFVFLGRIKEAPTNCYSRGRWSRDSSFVLFIDCLSDFLTLGWSFELNLRLVFASCGLLCLLYETMEPLKTIFSYS
mmetsp:Transcript_8910/g.13681  ORF Transcript_8910/g.13681 Transcript_8910/m.13681 type:complete len:80 (+) Transcript_8910:240-479(+)